MEIGETILIWRRLLLGDLLRNDLGFDGKTLLFQLISLIGMSDGKYMPPQGEIVLPDSSVGTKNETSTHLVLFSQKDAPS